MSVFSWENINNLGRLKIFRIAMILFVLLPIAVKIFGHIPDKINILGFKESIPITMKLPFNWIVLYFASLSITLGSIIYNLYCPIIIKRYPDYYEFSRSGMTNSFLYKELKKCIPKNERKKNLSDIVRSILSEEVHGLSVAADKVEIDSIIRILDPKLKLETGDPDVATRSAFFFVHDSSQLRHPAIRVTTLLLYIAGLSMVLYVTLEKILYVLNLVIRFCFKN